MRRANIVLVVLISILAGSQAFASVWYVSPSGSSTGDGSRANPWDLVTAFNAPMCIKPGDTIFLRAGTYGTGADLLFYCYLKGAEDKPIWVRSFPGERATINGGLVLLENDASYVVLYDLEVTNSSLNRTGPKAGTRSSALLLAGNGCRARNLLIHDCGHPGIGLRGKAVEVYGTLIWANGLIATDPGYGGDAVGSAIYTGTNMGIKTIEQVIAFRNYNHGIKMYAEGGQVAGYRVFDNTAFCQFGGMNIYAGDVDPESVTEDIEVRRNNTFHVRGSLDRQSVEFGYMGDNADFVATDNIFLGGNLTESRTNLESSMVSARKWEDIEFTGNTVAGLGRLVWFKQIASPGSQTWNNNAYYGGPALPFYIDNDSTNYDWDDWKTETGFDANSTYDTLYPAWTKTAVTANKYETGRGHITVYNLLGTPTVNVDVSKVVKAGEYYELRDAQNYFGSLVASGTYNGGHITIPMDQTTVAQPVGEGFPDGYEETFVPTAPHFGVFIITTPSRNVVWLEADDRTASEDGPSTGQFTVCRSGATSSALTVNYTVGGSAVSTSDYSALSGSVTIAADATTATVTITPVDDAVEEDAETVTLTLTPGDGYRLDAGQTADTVVIADNDGFLNTGLLAHWKLDDGQGAVAKDSGPACNDGVVVDGTWITDGEIAGAMTFDGTDDAIAVEPMLAGRTAYTMSAWLRSTSTERTIVVGESHGTNNTPGIKIRTNINEGSVGFIIRDDAGVSLSGDSNDLDYHDGEWHHVILVRDGGTATLYADGEAVASATGTSPGTTTLTHGTIGAQYRSNSYMYLFDGDVDDVRLYDYAMDECEAYDLYDAGVDTQAPTAPTNLAVAQTPGLGASLSWTASTDDVGVAGYIVSRDGTPVCSTTGTSCTDSGLSENTTHNYSVVAYDGAGNVSTPATAPVTTGGLIAWWKLDEMSGSTAADSSDSQNNGTVADGTWTTNGVIAGAMAFDGADDYVSVTPSLANLGNYTISAWFKTSATDAVSVYEERNTGDGSPIVFVRLNDSGKEGRIRFVHQDDADVKFTRWITQPGSNDYITDANDGSWHHFVAVRTAADTWVFYYDGAMTGALTSNAPGTTTVNGAAIGATPSATPANFFDGPLDDVRLYSRALSESEAEALYDAGDAYTCADYYPPTQPGSFLVTGATTDTVSISWSASTDNVAVTGYRVYANWEPVATTAGTSYTYEDLDEGTSYTLHVCAYDAAGNSSEPAGPAQVYTLLDSEVTLACWTLDDGTGSIADDASPNENDGTLVGVPTWTGTGAVDGALTFDGTDDYVTVAPSLATNTTYSLSVWFKTESADCICVYGERNTGNSTPYLFLWVNYDHEGQIRFFHRGDTDVEFSRIVMKPEGGSYIDSANDGNWHHLVVVREAADTFTFYYDGVLADSVTGNNPGTTTMNIGTIGADRYTTATKHFDGVIDQVRLYDHAIDYAKVRCLDAEAEE